MWLLSLIFNLQILDMKTNPQIFDFFLKLCYNNYVRKIIILFSNYEPSVDALVTQLGLSK